MGASMTQRTLACGGNQGRGDPPAFHPHRLRPQDYDTLGDRMQPPTDGYSVWGAIAGFVCFVVVVSVLYVLNVKGLK
jgi:hypothetical protein